MSLKPITLELRDLILLSYSGRVDVVEDVPQL